MSLRLRRGPSTDRISIVFQAGELVYDTTEKRLYVGDDLTQGGVPVSDLLGDLSPQLGGNLDLNGKDIIGFGNLLIDGDITASGTLTVPNIVTDVTGSIFGDDSTPLVDGANSRLVLTNNSINDLADVDITTLTNNQVLNWKNGAWRNTDQIQASIIDSNGNAILDSTNSIARLTLQGNILAADGTTEILDNTQITVAADIVSPNSEIVVDHTLKLFNGDVIGNLDGDVTGNVLGDLVGNVTGDVLGDLVGNVTGDVLGDLVGNVTGDVIGDLVGNVTGDLTGNITGDVVGNVTGSLTGNIVGNSISDIIFDYSTRTLYNPEINLTSNSLDIIRDGALTLVKLYYQNTTQDISGTDPEWYGGVIFARDDINGPLDTATIYGGNRKIVFSVDPNGISGFQEAKYCTMLIDATDSTMFFGVGTATPTQHVDVRGNGTFSGFLQVGRYADAAARDAAVTSPAEGMIVFNQGTQKFQGYVSDTGLAGGGAQNSTPGWVDLY